jgi:hypothetical protein
LNIDQNYFDYLTGCTLIIANDILRFSGESPGSLGVG